jgi:hypothetical protein
MGCGQSLDTSEQNKPVDLPKKLKYHVTELEKSTVENVEEQIETSRSIKRSPPSFIARTIRSFSVASTDSYRTSVYTGHYYDVTSGLTNVELINTIKWIEEFKPNIKEFKTLKEDAMLEYKEKIRNQLSSYFTNINLRHDVGTNTDKTIYTTIPEDHFAMIDTCANVVKENLGSSHVKEIIVMALQLLRDELRTLYDNFSNEQLDTRILCAYVNDFIRMKTLCSDLNEDIYTYESNELTNEMFDILINQIPDDYNKIIDHTLDLIVKNILDDLHKVFFSKLFTKEWEVSDIDARVLVATLKDHFSDILIWLNSSQHNKIILTLMNETLSQYIFGLENRKNKKFINKVSAIAKVTKDKTIMKAYFCKLHSSADEFDILDNICKLLLKAH